MCQTCSNSSCGGCGPWTLPTGPTGPQGPAGTNGTNGTNGANGTNGINGVNIIHNDNADSDNQAVAGYNAFSPAKTFTWTFANSNHVVAAGDALRIAAEFEQNTAGAILALVKLCLNNDTVFASPDDPLTGAGIYSLLMGTMAGKYAGVVYLEVEINFISTTSQLVITKVTFGNSTVVVGRKDMAVDFSGASATQPIYLVVSPSPATANMIRCKSFKIERHKKVV